MKLTKAQLEQVGIVNAWDIQKDGGWDISFTSWSRATAGGWKLNCRTKPNRDPKRHYQDYDSYRVQSKANGNSRPADSELVETLAKIGAIVPTRWVKFLGSWWDADFVDMKMVELSAKLKEQNRALAYGGTPNVRPEEQ